MAAGERNYLSTEARQLVLERGVFALQSCNALGITTDLFRNATGFLRDALENVLHEYGVGGRVSH